MNILQRVHALFTYSHISDLEMVRVTGGNHNQIVSITLLYVHFNEKEALIKTRHKDFQDVETELRKSIKTQISLL